MKRVELSNEYLMQFYKEMYYMTRSGIDISESLDTLKVDETDKPLREMLTRMQLDTSDGKKLSEAIQIVDNINQYDVDLIKLGEETGKLEDVFLSLHKYYKRKIQLDKQVKSALILPSIMLLTMVIVIMLLITQVMPVFNSVFNQMGVQLGTFALAMINLSHGLINASKTIMIVLLVIVVLTILISVIPFTRKKAITIFQTIGVKLGLTEKGSIAHLTSALSLGISSGLDMEQSFTLASNICKGTKKLDTKLNQCLEDIKSGKNVAKSLEDNEILPIKYCRTLTVAEKTANLDEAFETIASDFEAQSELSKDNKLNAIEPLIIIIMSLISGLLLISIITPLLGIL